MISFMLFIFLFSPVNLKMQSNDSKSLPKKKCSVPVPFIISSSYNLLPLAKRLTWHDPHE